MSKDLKTKKITNFFTFLAKNGTFWEMYIENDPKPQNIGQLRGFDEKKSKKLPIFCHFWPKMAFFV